MNCDESYDKLIDLVYDELDDEQRHDVEAHVEQCPTCSRELGRLRLVRRALAELRGAEPVAPVVAGMSSSFAASPLRRRLAPYAAAAAVVLMATAAWMLFRATEPVAFAGPVEIRRLGVSLTILSEPEASPTRSAYYSAQPASQPSQMRRRRRRYRPWTGLALVRDQRIIRNLPRGESEVHFTGVPSGIRPDSVRLRPVDRPDGLAILEQNYQYDLASASAILQKHIDKTVRVAFTDGTEATGTLLGFDGATLILQPTSEGPRNISRANVRAIAFDKLPKGLLTTPTLLWRLQNDAASDQQFEVAYLTGGITWRADYVLKLRPASNPASRERKRAGRAGQQPVDRESRSFTVAARDKTSGELEIQSTLRSSNTATAEDGNPKSLPAGRQAQSEIFDVSDLVGYATVTNNSGITYENAQLKLMAGDVNLIREELPLIQKGIFGSYSLHRVAGDAIGGFEEKSFFEYHLYTLGRATTIRSAETKQIELVSGSGVKLRRGYVYDPKANPTAARVVSELVNSEANGLGKPLPKGTLRLYAPDPTGESTFVARTDIDHTPKDEKIRLPWGYAFDIACESTQMDVRHDGIEHHERIRYTIRNHKDYDVTVTVIARVHRTTYKATCNFPWHVRQVGLVEIEVPVAANSQADAVFSHSYNHDSGGGLKSPHDRQ